MHYGHLLVAETCREQCELDEVWWVPAATPPHKQDQTLADGRQRAEMVELAVAGHPAMRVLTRELERGGVSYTVDTLALIRDERPDDQLFLLMGADSLVDLPTWRQPQRICELATPLVVSRAGSPEPHWEAFRPFCDNDRLEQLKQLSVDMPIVELSSTRIRQAVQSGRSIRFQTPRSVEEYIQANGLYRRQPI